MSKTSAPEGMITVEEFSKRKGISEEKAIKMIKDGFYTGRVIDEIWFVSIDEVNSSSSDSSIASSGSMSDDYKTSISVSKLVSFIGWLAVLGGIILSFTLMKEGGMALLGLASSITVILVGLLLVIGGQASRAVMDNANYSKQMLEEMRK